MPDGSVLLSYHLYSNTSKLDVEVFVLPEVSLATTVMLYQPNSVRFAGTKTKSVAWLVNCWRSVPFGYVTFAMTESNHESEALKSIFTDSTPCKT